MVLYKHAKWNPMFTKLRWALFNKWVPSFLLEACQRQRRQAKSLEETFLKIFTTTSTISLVICRATCQCGQSWEAQKHQKEIDERGKNRQAGFDGQGVEDLGFLGHVRHRGRLVPMFLISYLLAHFFCFMMLHLRVVFWQDIFMAKKKLVSIF